jgi:hypothetical protein
MEPRTGPTSYKRYSPSPNSNSAGDQTARPEPLIDKFKWSGLLHPLGERFIQSNSPAEVNTMDNLSVLNWVVRATWFTKDFDECALDEPHPSSRDVYVVRRTHGNFPALAPMHWSVYTQGHFYHLSVENREGSATPSGVQIPNGQIVVLKDEDHSQAGGDGDDVTPTPNPKGRLPPLLVAYHVGQTDYTSSELRDLAGQIISDIASYSFARQNCQHFVTTFIMNILMRKRNNTNFIGTDKQIASWDLREKDTGVHSNTMEKGFLVLTPPKRTLLLHTISQLRLIRSEYF